MIRMKTRGDSRLVPNELRRRLIRWRKTFLISISDEVSDVNDVRYGR